MEPLTITDTATRMRVSRWTVHRLLADNELAPVVYGGVRHVDTSSIGAYIHRQTIVPDQQEQSPMSNLPKLYTLAEVAAMHPELSVRVLAEQARDKKIEHVHFGRRRFMTAEQIETLIKSRTVRTTEDEALAKVAARRRRRTAA